MLTYLSSKNLKNIPETSPLYPPPSNFKLSLSEFTKMKPKQNQNIVSSDDEVNLEFSDDNSLSSKKEAFFDDDKEFKIKDQSKPKEEGKEKAPLVKKLESEKEEDEEAGLISRKSSSGYLGLGKSDDEKVSDAESGEVDLNEMKKESGSFPKKVSKRKMKYDDFDKSESGVKASDLNLVTPVKREIDREKKKLDTPPLVKAEKSPKKVNDTFKLEDNKNQIKKEEESKENSEDSLFNDDDEDENKKEEINSQADKNNQKDIELIKDKSLEKEKTESKMNEDEDHDSLFDDSDKEEVKNETPPVQIPKHSNKENPSKSESVLVKESKSETFKETEKLFDSSITPPVSKIKKKSKKKKISRSKTPAKSSKEKRGSSKNNRRKRKKRRKKSDSSKNKKIESENDEFMKEFMSNQNQKDEDLMGFRNNDSRSKTPPVKNEKVLNKREDSDLDFKVGKNNLGEEREPGELLFNPNSRRSSKSIQDRRLMKDSTMFDSEDLREYKNRMRNKRNRKDKRSVQIPKEINVEEIISFRKKSESKKSKKDKKRIKKKKKSKKVKLDTILKKLENKKKNKKKSKKKVPEK
jgi:hypothetical protein